MDSRTTRNNTICLMNMHEFGIIFLYFHGVRALIYSSLDTYIKNTPVLNNIFCIMHFLLPRSQLKNISTMHLFCSFNLNISKLRIKNICKKKCLDKNRYSLIRICVTFDIR